MNKHSFIIFLDIDGVLCSYDDLKLRDADGEHTFRDYSVEALNMLVAYYGAKIVISSSWRRKHTFRHADDFQALFNHRGVEVEVLGLTPYLKGVRGDEINAWLDANPTERYIVLDDETPDMEGITDMQYVWKTNRWRCLDSYDVRAAIFRFDRIFAGKGHKLPMAQSN
jgi:hypothetical protein